MHHDLSLKQMQQQFHGKATSYILGFIFCLLLTLLSFGLVAYQVLEPSSLIYTVCALALIQAAFQLVFFLHLGKEGKPHWETLSFCFMFLILLIIVAGSLWIMHDLNERTMSYMEMTK